LEVIRKNILDVVATFTTHTTAGLRAEWGPAIVHVCGCTGTTVSIHNLLHYMHAPAARW